MCSPLINNLPRKLIYLVCFISVLYPLQIRAANAADASLVGWWKFDDGSGSAALDASGNGNDGTLQGNPMWVAGKIGGALKFNGSDDHVDCGNSENLKITGEITIAAWIYPTEGGDSTYPRIVDKSSGTGYADPGYKVYLRSAENYIVTLSGGGANRMSASALTLDTWNYLVFIMTGTQWKLFLNGTWEIWDETALPSDVDNPLFIGNSPVGDRHFSGILDEVRIYNRALKEEEIQAIMSGEEYPYALAPEPVDGSLVEDTWANLSWSPGDFAVSHNVYIGNSFDDVDDGIESTFQGNQAATEFIVGFPGFPFPEGLVPGTTYYWRVDEVNETEPNSPWKGDIWSFSIPPKTAYFPDPADGTESVDVGVKLSWTGGFGSKLHTVYLGEAFEEVDDATGGQAQGTTVFTPGTLKMAKTYYWRVDEFDIIETHKGNVWSFTTDGAVESLNPVNGAVDVTQTPVLTWAPGFGASHEIYFGSDPASLELKGSGNLGSESYEPGQLEWNTTYYWRVDEANSANADSPWTGPLWSFTTANFLIIDDMESYNDINEGEPGSNRIYLAWVDGYENPTVNGSVVGNDPPPIAEQTIVHSGLQSMPMAYNNAVGKSEATLTLTSNRDWTINGVNRLTIWYRGTPSNAAEQMYVVLNGSAGVDHEDPAAAQAAGWNEWNIDLQAFADQGVNLSNVTSITIGLGNRANPVAGGAGMLYFDDIRLYAPEPETP